MSELIPSTSLTFLDFSCPFRKQFTGSNMFSLIMLIFFELENLKYLRDSIMAYFHRTYRLHSLVIVDRDNTKPKAIPIVRF